MPAAAAPQGGDAVADFFNKFANSGPASQPPVMNQTAPSEQAAPGSLSMAIPAFTPGAAGYVAQAIAVATGGNKVSRVQLQHTLYSLTMNETFLENVYGALQKSGHASD